MHCNLLRKAFDWSPYCGTTHCSHACLNISTIYLLTLNLVDARNSFYMAGFQSKPGKTGTVGHTLCVDQHSDVRQMRREWQRIERYRQL